MENASLGEINGELEYGRMGAHISKWLPCKFSPIYLTENEISNMIFDKSLFRWTPKDFMAALE